MCADGNQIWATIVDQTSKDILELMKFTMSATWTKSALTALTMTPKEPNNSPLPHLYEVEFTTPSDVAGGGCIVITLVNFNTPTVGGIIGEFRGAQDVLSGTFSSQANMLATYSGNDIIIYGFSYLVASTVKM